MGMRAWAVMLAQAPPLLFVLTQGIASILWMSNVREAERVQAAIHDGVARLVGDCDLAIDALDPC
jgi:hypothetical protein